MPKIGDLLPAKRLAQIKAHMGTKDYAERVTTGLKEMKYFLNWKEANTDVAPTLWASYGKDSMAMMLLAAEVGDAHQVAAIDNAMEIPQHYEVFDEFDQWIGYDSVIYTTEYKGIYYLDAAIKQCKEDREQQLKEKGSLPKSKQAPINFFEPGEAYDLFYYETIGQFHWEHMGETENTVQMWSTRACEGMGRQWELNKNGKMFIPSFCKKKDQTPFWRCLPIGDWSDLDVWAYLMDFDAPVSAVYGMNEVSQRGKGRNYYPRTLWYCDPHVFSPAFAKWLKKYAPAQLLEVCTVFPEVKERFSKKRKK